MNGNKSTPDEINYLLSEIYIYPIKSLGGISLNEALLEERGLKYDRRWMLVDKNGVFLTQRKHFEMALLQVSISNSKITITHKINADLKISFSTEEYTGEAIPITIWNDRSTGVEVNTQVSDWLSHLLKMKVKLVKMPAEHKRPVDPKYASNNEIVSFADDYPCLIIGQSSLDALNAKLPEPILMDRFRPNFVFTGGEPHIEDKFKTFQLGNSLFSAVKPCARCVLTTVNQQTGAKGQEPLRTLASYRTFDKKVMFGQNLIHQGLGIVRVGDELKIKEWK